MEQVKWYEKKNLVIGLLIIFWPVGVIGLWLSPHFEKKTKGIITGVIAVAMVIFASVGGFGTDGNVQSTETQVVGHAAKPAPAPKAQTPKFASIEEAKAHFNAKLGFAIIYNPPFEPDMKYYEVQGQIDGKDGEYYRAKLERKGDVSYFSFRPLPGVEHQEFRMGQMVYFVGQMVKVSKYQTMGGAERYMPVFDVVYFKIFSSYGPVQSE